MPSRRGSAVRRYRAPVYRAQFAEAALGAGVPTPVVPPDSLQVSETVSVVWEIARADLRTPIPRPETPLA